MGYAEVEYTLFGPTKKLLISGMLGRNINDCETRKVVWFVFLSNKYHQQHIRICIRCTSVVCVVVRRRQADHR